MKKLQEKNIQMQNNFKIINYLCETIESLIDILKNENLTNENYEHLQNIEKEFFKTNAR